MNKIGKRIGNPFEWIGLTVCQDCSLSELELTLLIVILVDVIISGR